MNVMVPKKRRDGKSSFVKLVTYVSLRDDKKLDETLSPDTPFVRPSRSNEVVFDRLVDYINRTALPSGEHIIHTSPDGYHQVWSDNVACETNCFSIDTAAAEMNTVAEQNVRKKDPVYHFILSWREEDKPADGDIFDAARYCLRQIGMAEHQYVTAIHRDTNHTHCHVAVNRVNPVSFRMADKYYALDQLQQSCRKLELKYNWTPDNGSWVMNDLQQVVRAKRDYQPAPQGARQLEYHADRESLYTYAVDNCRDKLEALFQENMRWGDVHNVLIEAGLELRRKGEGLAVYPLPREGEKDTEQRPIKASRLHPKLTLTHLEPKMGNFFSAPPAEHYTPGKRVYANLVLSEYDDKLHVRDRGARIERRVARAEARDDLKARYKAYKNSWVKPGIPSEEVKRRYRDLADEFRQRKARVRVTVQDPQIRKLMYRTLVVEKMQAEAQLRATLREERDGLRAEYGSRPMSYRAWVEAQAMDNDVAAISQLRGWAYRQKRKDRTATLSKHGFQCGVADDIPPYDMTRFGYDTEVHRDGAIIYRRQGEAVVLDRGDRVEVLPGDTRNTGAAVVLANRKSGEVLEIKGDRAFVEDTVKVIGRFNQQKNTQLPLTNPTQKQWLGYGDSHTPGRTSTAAQSRLPQDKPEPKKNNPSFKPGQG